MAAKQHETKWLLELLKQNRFIQIHDGLGTFVHKCTNGWQILGRDDVMVILDQRMFNDLSVALDVAKSLRAIFTQSRTTNAVACVKHVGGWCACVGTTTRYRDQVRTKCNHTVVLPLGLEFRQPTCYKCLKALCK